MHLEVVVIGPGFGETILLKWQEGERVVGAIVDCYSIQSGRQIIDWLERLGIEHLRFVIATHPHLDHIKNMANVLRHFEGRVDLFLWWGGLDQSAYIEYFDQVAWSSPDSQDDTLSQRADAVRELLMETHRQRRQFGCPQLLTTTGLQQIYPLSPADPSPVRVFGFSPCGEELLQFVRIVAEGIDRSGEVEDNHRACNRVSIGAIVRFGKAQVVLGGDVEEANWAAALHAPLLEPLAPSLVKVSHHGSCNGRIEGMWALGGFIGRAPKPPIAIVTPYRGRLPDEQVIDEIHGAGCDVYVTGRNWASGRSGLPFQADSYVWCRVGDDGEAEVIDCGPGVRILRAAPGI